MQEYSVLIGQSDCYSKGSEILSTFFPIKLGNTQIFRVTDFYGAQLEKERPSITGTLPTLALSDCLYVQIDGSMILTRTVGWHEVKLGRIFKGSDCIYKENDSGHIKISQYFADMDTCKVFTEQMQKIIDSYGVLGKRLIFISDGAPWIRKWINDNYPNAISVLDYYHASEYLHKFVKEYFTETKSATKWCTYQLELLNEGGVSNVINNIKALPNYENKGGQEVIRYYEKNKERMDYKYYKTVGAGLIGSGAIESAHRTVIQKRMKLSGQRWTEEGAQNMLNLRTTHMNDQWYKIQDLVKINATRAA